MADKILKFASVFTGGGGADQGARMAGLKHLWGIEVDPGYAAIAQANGFNTLVQDVRTVDFAELEPPDWLHASPPCTRASVANPNHGETILDSELVMTVVNTISILEPTYFSFENVPAYQHFDSYVLLCRKLVELGYSLSERTLNAANYGIPQTRKRLFLVGSRIGLGARMPYPTHHQPSEQMEMFARPWVSWEDALKAVAPASEYKLSDRLQSMIPDSFAGIALMTGWNQYTGRNRSGLTIRRKDMPAPTLLAKMTQPSMRPMIIERYPSETKAYVLDVPQMAALQGFPRYRWGNHQTRAREAIGNAVPPLMMQKIIETNVKQIA